MACAYGDFKTQLIYKGVNFPETEFVLIMSAS